MSFTVSCDSSVDVYPRELEKMEVACIPLTFIIDGVEYEEKFDEDSQYQKFYDDLKTGALPTTSQINTFRHEEFFKNLIENHGAKNILHISLSAGLSNTVNSAKLAAENIMKSHEGTFIHIVDTKCATQGNHYILDETVKLRDSGMSAKDAIEYLDDLGKHLHHWILVQDLHHLKRGGRVSGPAAAIGTLLNIKPILNINDKGELVVLKKIKGVNKALNYIITMIKEHSVTQENITFYIADGDSHEMCDEFEKMLEENFKDCKIVKGWVGPVIGTHVGSGMMGLVFKAHKRLNG